MLINSFVERETIFFPKFSILHRLTDSDGIPLYASVMPKYLPQHILSHSSIIVYVDKFINASIIHSQSINLYSNSRLAENQYSETQDPTGHMMRNSH